MLHVVISLGIGLAKARGPRCGSVLDTEGGRMGVQVCWALASVSLGKEDR